MPEPYRPLVWGTLLSFLAGVFAWIAGEPGFDGWARVASLGCAGATTWLAIFCLVWANRGKLWL
jgi:hypothetical protein